MTRLARAGKWGGLALSRLAASGDRAKERRAQNVAQGNAAETQHGCA